MEFIFKLLVVLLLVICIASSVHVVAYYASSCQRQMEAHDITSEGPDCRTFRWYVMDAVARFDDLLCELCRAIGNDKPLIIWRTWLKEQHGLTMY